MENYSELKRLVASIEDDANKFYVKDNKAAGVRLRKGLGDIKALAQDMRLEVSKINKGR